MDVVAEATSPGAGAIVAAAAAIQHAGIALATGQLVLAVAVDAAGWEAGLTLHLNLAAAASPSVKLQGAAVELNVAVVASAMLVAKAENRQIETCPITQ